MGGGLKHISHLHPPYASLHYVLLFPRGGDGWHKDIDIHLGPSGWFCTKSGKVSQTLYHAYRLHTGTNEQPILFYGGRLFQQYCVDAWAST